MAEPSCSKQLSSDSESNTSEKVHAIKRDLSPEFLESSRTEPEEASSGISESEDQLIIIDTKELLATLEKEIESIQNEIDIPFSGPTILPSTKSSDDEKLHVQKLLAKYFEPERKPILSQINEEIDADLHKHFNSLATDLDLTTVDGPPSGNSCNDCQIVDRKLSPVRRNAMKRHVRVQTNMISKSVVETKTEQVSAPRAEAPEEEVNEVANTLMDLKLDDLVKPKLGIQKMPSLNIRTELKIQKMPSVITQ